jgi:hypothetical protein
MGEKTATSKDSLQSVIDELDKFSFDETPAPAKRQAAISSGSGYTTTQPLGGQPLKEKESQEDFVNAAEAEMEKFFSTSKNAAENKNTKGVKVMAVVNYDQEIKSNSRVEMILVQDLSIGGRRFPKNTYIYGIAKFSGYRLNIYVSKIKDMEVSLNVYDYQDGNMGLYVDPDNIGQEVRDAATDGLIDDADADDIPLGNTIKGVFKRKNKESSVILLNNYKVILKS